MNRALPLVLLLAGCTTAPTNVPSLLPRAIETRSDADTPRPDRPVTADAELDRRIAERVAAFGTAAKGFDAAAKAAGARVGAAGRASAGSEPWLAAQTALGDLSQARAIVDGALSDIEALAIERATAGLLPYPALDAAIATAQAEVDRQADADGALQARLAR